MRRYLEILKSPGAFQFSLSGLVARLPSAMVSMGIVLMVSGIYGNYRFAGALSAAFVVAQAVGSPLVARLIDRYGQARVTVPIMAFSLFMLSVMAVLASYKLPEAALFGPAICSGATYVSIGPMVRARWTAALSQPDQLHTAFSLESALDEVTYVVGPAFATLLATGWTLVAGVLVPVGLAVLGVAWFVSQRATEPAVQRSSLRGLSGRTRSVLFFPGMAAVVGGIATMGGMFGSFDVSVVAVAESWGNKSHAAIVLTSFAAGSCLAGFAYGARNWSGPVWRAYLIGLSGLAVGFSTFYFIGSIWLLALVTFVVGCLIAPTIITANQLIKQLVPSSRLVEGLTWVGASIGVGFSFGSTLSGWLIDHVSPRTGFLGGITACVLAVTTCLLAIPVLRRATAEKEAAV